MCSMWINKWHFCVSIFWAENMSFFTGHTVTYLLTVDIQTNKKGLSESIKWDYCIIGGGNL